MDALTRRRLLLASGVASGAALAVGAGGIALAELLRTAPDERPTVTDRKISKVVLVTLYGGNDGLNTVIPYTDPAYYSARPELAYAPEEVLPLDGELGLNPIMRGLKRLWDARQLAIVRGVGYPKPSRSHFRSMDIWQTASPVTPATTGWIGRWLDGKNAAVEAAVSFEPVLPPLLAGKRHVGLCVNYRALFLPNWVDPKAVAALGHGEAGEPEMQARAAAAFADLLTMSDVLREAKQAEVAPDPTNKPGVAATGTDGKNELATQLALVARCIEAGVATRVYSVSLGGFDTHAAERAWHELLLKRLDEALSAFVARMANSEAGRQVAVVVYSEFGRRVRANGSDGTDHGTAGPVFALGSRVTGGFYGEEPSLSDLDDGDLKATTDFRAVYGTLLASVLQSDPEQYIEGYRGSPIPFVPVD